MDVHFYYDVVCPYAYLASTRVEALAQRAGATLHWHPVLLGGIYTAVEAAQNPGASMPVSKARLNLLDMHRQAERLGVPLELNARHPQRSVEAMRLLTAAPAAVRPALTHALYRHYQVEQGSLDREGLAPIAAAHGLDVSVIDSDAARQGLRATTAEAVAHGAFGVPAVVVGDTLFWGADRLDDVARALGVTPDPKPVGAPRTGARVEFFHDFSSPFSCLAALRVEALAEAAGAELIYRPMLLGAVFHAIGTPMIPIQAMSEAKRRWVGDDLRRWAERTNFALRWPSAFPLHTVKALRVSMIEPATIRPMYEAAWRDDRNLGDPAVLQAVLDEAGFDGGALLARTGDPEVKAALKASTTMAVEAGVCGAPSFRVNGQWLFWGQDRMDMVDAALRGWEPRVG